MRVRGWALRAGEPGSKRRVSFSSRRTGNWGFNGTPPPSTVQSFLSPPPLLLICCLEAIDLIIPPPPLLCVQRDAQLWHHHPRSAKGGHWPAPQPLQADSRWAANPHALRFWWRGRSSIRSIEMSWLFQKSHLSPKDNTKLESGSNYAVVRVR